MKTVITIEFESKSDLQQVLSEIRVEIQKGYTKSSGLLPAIRQPVESAAAPCPPMPPGYTCPPQKLAFTEEDLTKELAPTYYEYAIEE